MRASLALLLLSSACGPETGLLFDVSGPSSGGSSTSAGIASLEFRVGSRTACDRFIEATDARTTVDVRGRDLARAPYELLVRPTHVTDLASPIVALALARDAGGQLLGIASFGQNAFGLHRYLEHGAQIDLLDRSQPVASYLPADGCACVPSDTPWIGSGARQGCDQAIVTSFDSLVGVAGCELAPGSSQSKGPVCDGQRYPLTFYEEPIDRAMPCFAPRAGGGGCAVGSRTCRDQEGVAFTRQCAPDANALPVGAGKLCSAYLGCEGCGDQLACFRAQLGAPINFRCLVHLDPSSDTPKPCADGKWQTIPLGQPTAGGCAVVMLDGIDQPPFRVGFLNASNGGGLEAAAACPASLVIESITPDALDPLTIPHELYFTIGEQLAHATFTVVRTCSSASSLECHSG